MSTITVFEVLGEKVPIEVDGGGVFSARPNPDMPSIGARTLDELKEKIKIVVKKMKATTPVEITILGGKIDGAGYVNRGDRDATLDATLRGVAERSGKLLLTIGGKKCQTDSYASSMITSRRLTADEIKQYRALVATVKAAEADVATFIARVRIEPEQALGLKP